ncbi:unnamed protein product [Rhizophagus irregularis]|nr:unnamed protein product [Rhizophagus irregularis]
MCIIIIDSDQRSRIVATAIVCDETVSTYEWILEQTMRATGGLQPVTVFTDADPAMQIAISNQYPKTIVRHFAFHIHQNLVKKIKKKLNDKWDTFEELLQHFIEAQTNILDVTTIDQHNNMFSEAGTVNIANPHQHKGKGRPANNRYLSAIENYSSNTNNDIQEETSNARRKKNKRQCSICKSWYHDSRNCPKKNKEVHIEDKENF